MFELLGRDKKTKAICPTNENAVFKYYPYFKKKYVICCVRDAVFKYYPYFKKKSVICCAHARTHVLNVHGQPQHDTWHGGPQFFFLSDVETMQRLLIPHHYTRVYNTLIV